MAHLPKLLFMIAMLLPGGVLLAPALLWWMRRREPAERPESTDDGPAHGVGVA